MRKSNVKQNLHAMCVKSANEADLNWIINRPGDALP